MHICLRIVNKCNREMFEVYTNGENLNHQNLKTKKQLFRVKILSL